MGDMTKFNSAIEYYIFNVLLSDRHSTPDTSGGLLAYAL